MGRAAAVASTVGNHPLAFAAMDGDGLRARLDSGETVVLAGCFDALSARLAAAAGFESLFLSGYCTAATLLGLPDFGYLTQTEMAEAARRVCSSVPAAQVVVDGDTGYGNPLNTIRTVELYERAGAAGIFLEDQLWPKKCGHMTGKKVVPAQEWLAKLRAAVENRDKLFVTARTDARAAIGLHEACERARMAADTGVDAIFVEAPESVEDMEAIAKATPGCIRVANMIEGGRTPLRTPAELHELGFDLIVSPLTGLLAATRQMQRAYAVLHERGTLRDDLDLVTAFDQFGDIVELDRHYGLEARYVVNEPVDGLAGEPG
jgi:methylisocitrate lyase